MKNFISDLRAEVLKDGEPYYIKHDRQGLTYYASFMGFLKDHHLGNCAIFRHPGLCEAIIIPYVDLHRYHFIHHTR